MEKYHSQHEEEKVILQYVGDKTDGKYIDIGAGHSSDLSNTMYFYEKGWSGLCFEPNPEQSTKEDWSKIRPRDIFLPVALSDHEGTIEMISTGCLDSFIGEIYSTKERAIQGPNYTVQCMTMMKALELYPEFKEVDFMSIDVDTYEHKIFAGMDFNIFKPKLICVEYMVRTHDFRKNWEHLLLPFYEPKEVITGNCFYLRK